MCSDLGSRSKADAQIANCAVYDHLHFIGNVHPAFSCFHLASCTCSFTSASALEPHSIHCVIDARAGNATLGSVGGLAKSDQLAFIMLQLGFLVETLRCVLGAGLTNCQFLSSTSSLLISTHYFQWDFPSAACQSSNPGTGILPYVLYIGVIWPSWAYSGIRTAPLVARTVEPFLKQQQHRVQRAVCNLSRFRIARDPFCKWEANVTRVLTLGVSQGDVVLTAVVWLLCYASVYQRTYILDLILRLHFPIWEALSGYDHLLTWMA